MATPARFCCLCGRSAEEVGPISGRGRCAECADRAMLENTNQIRRHRGPYFQHWRRRTILAHGGLLADGDPANPEAA